MKDLHEGKVLPIFHTLCRPPEERHFSPERQVSVKDANSDEIQLSAAQATMGDCNFSSEKGKGMVGEISSRCEASYIPAFFNDDVGIVKVQDAGFNWEYDDDYTKIITDLVNAPAAMVGEDIEVSGHRVIGTIGRRHR